MRSQDDTKAGSGPKVPGKKDAAASGKQEGGGRSVGDALRAVYREAADESVPDSMLDLLSKLD